MKVFREPTIFKATDRKWHVQTWRGGSLTACGRHVEWDGSGEIQYATLRPLDSMHPVCCSQCAAKYATDDRFLA